jgi:lipoprotein-anchoring transpeptidase ErfK/SrfK
MSRARVDAIVLSVIAAVVGVGSTDYAATVLGDVSAAVTPRAAAEATVSAPAGKGVPPFVTVTRAKVRPSGRAAGTATSSRTSTTMAPKPKPSTAVALCASAERQRDVEEALSSLEPYRSVAVDGVQSAGDCAVIRRFQQRFGIEPAHGQADTTTADVGRRIAASSQPEKQAACDAGPGVTACVDLSLQTVWVVKDGAVVVGPTVVRTGFRGYATPAGRFTINKRDLREWSDPYNVWLPYWQRFVGGIGFHETVTYLHDPTLGSHGCVNLLHGDAVAIWNQLHMGATVHVFGRRPGT